VQEFLAGGAEQLFSFRIAVQKALLVEKKIASFFTVSPGRHIQEHYTI